MKSESLPVEIKFSDPQDPISFCDTGFSLNGVINIVSFNELRLADFDNSKCRLPENSLELLSNEFESLLERETCYFSDVTLKCGNASIPAHKNVLSARSPVFAAMFKNPMKKNLENEVDIGDVDEPILRIMLTYIYAGKTSNLTVSSASELFSAACKYQLQDLKNMCLEFLKDNVCLENVLRILVLGDMHDENLKLWAMEYICQCTQSCVLEDPREWDWAKDYLYFCKQLSVLEKLQEWDKLLEERPALGSDVMQFLLVARKNNKSRLPQTQHE